MDTFIPFASLRRVPLSYATCSIGTSKHDTLPRRLEAISAAGFTGIELSFPDILAYGSSILGHEIDPKDYEELTRVTADIRHLVNVNGLKVMMLQPFGNFEGWPQGSPEREDVFQQAHGWIDIMNTVGTDLLQVGSSDTPSDKMSTNRETIVSDLRELADLLAQHNKRLAYENWCWSTHAPTWRDVWEIVEAIDRPNVGLCLDTFQTAGGEFGDPTQPTGVINDNKTTIYKTTMTNFRKSLADLASTVPPERIYLLQISDAYKPVSGPLEDKTIDGLRPRGRWSHDFRPMPYDGGYLPIEEVARAVLQTGFRGWFSMEIFDGGPDGKGKTYEMNDFARKAMESMRQFLRNCSSDQRD